jgi:hypothetical protein
MIFMALSVAAREASLLLSSGGISARHREAYTARKALSNFKPLTAAETVDRAGFSRRRDWSRIRVRHGNESFSGQRKIK